MTAFAILLVFWAVDIAFWAATRIPGKPRPIWLAWIPGSGFYCLAKQLTVGKNEGKP